MAADDLCILDESGAPQAVFSGDLLVGSLDGDPARFGTDRLEALPLTALAAEPDFARHLLSDPQARLVLDAVEAERILRAPYEQPLAALLANASYRLLRAEHGLVP